MKLALSAEWKQGPPKSSECNFPVFLAFTKDSGFFPQVCTYSSEFQGGFAVVNANEKEVTLLAIEPQDIFAWCPIPKFAIREESA